MDRVGGGQARWGTAGGGLPGEAAPTRPWQGSGLEAGGQEARGGASPMSSLGRPGGAACSGPLERWRPAQGASPCKPSGREELSGWIHSSKGRGEEEQRRAL